MKSLLKSLPHLSLWFSDSFEATDNLFKSRHVHGMISEWSVKASPWSCAVASLPGISPLGPRAQVVEQSC